MKVMNRRTFLRGLGTCISLPLLEAMAPSRSLAQEQALRRFMFVFQPSGFRNYAGQPFMRDHVLSPLQAHYDDIQVLGGLGFPNEWRQAYFPLFKSCAHDSAVNTFMSGIKPTSSDGGSVTASNFLRPKTFDQAIAEKIGANNRLRSLGLMVRTNPYGYDPIYRNHFSYVSTNTPLEMMNDPLRVFNELTAGGGTDEQKRQLELRLKKKKSILDFVLPDIKKVNSNLGRQDRQKMEQYLTGLEELERKIASLLNDSGSSGGSCGNSTLKQTIDQLESQSDPRYEEQLRVMYDLALLAFECDITRVIILHLGDRDTNLSDSLSGLEVTGNWHNATHENNGVDGTVNNTKIESYIADKFAEFVGKMKRSIEGDGTSVLNKSAVLYGGCMTNEADNDPHAPWNLSYVLAGQGGGLYPRGSGGALRKHKFSDTQVYDLWYTFMRDFGLNVSSYRSGVGTKYLSALKT